MLTCFNLKQGEDIEVFQQSLSRFAAHMQGLGLLHSISKVGRRQSDTIMDTDEERDHEFFFTMSFDDRRQCDLAVQHIYPHEAPSDSLHTALYTGIRDQVFICWEDIGG